MADNLDTAPIHEAEVNARDWPAYPMRTESGDEHKGMSWQRPTQQVASVKILKSNERPNLPAVFGTTLPPTGLSGLLRRFAFRFSESNGAHWITLILADRINMIEGVVDDVRKGHFPNVLGEMGLKSDLKYNRKGLALKTAAVVGVGGLGLYLAARSRKPNLRKRGFTRS